MINTVTLFGRLTADAEMKGNSSGIAIAKFSLAVNENKKNNEELTHYIDCTAFGRTAEIIRDYLGKGQPAVIQGKLHQDHWETKDGEKRTKLGVIVENLQLIPRTNGAPKQNSSSQPTQKSKAGLKKSSPGENEFESDMPF